MRLSAFLADVPGLVRRGGETDPEIAGLALDSRAVQPGDLFAALPGTRTDGRRFAQDAVARGAVAVLSAPGLDLDAPNVPLLFDPDPRRRLALMAARFHPRQPERLAAVTGTSGKTSTVEFCRQILAACGFAAASLGTLGARGPSGIDGYGLTSPDAITLHRTLDRLAEGGVEACALEASSHGLDQRRLDGVRVRAAAFTNLSRDHFDYHGDEESYFAAKRRLFDTILPEGATAVINADDRRAPSLIELARARGHRVVTTGEGGDDLRLLARSPHDGGQRLRVAVDGETRDVDLALLGTFQAINVLTALGLALALGAPRERALAALPGLAGVDGRMEPVGRSGRGASVVVDYAHKPDALTQALSALRDHCAGRLIVVFGCGGDRDPGKRPIMGEIAARLADRVVVTDDNPRSEDAATIRQEILRACPGGVEIGDRSEAIRAAVASAEAGDAVLIAGKGHETGQILGDRVLPFDDREAARAALASGAAP